MDEDAASLWSKLIHWIDSGSPFMRTQQMVAWAPLGFTLFIWPGPGTPAMWIAAVFLFLSLGLMMWRLFVIAKKRHRVDSMIRRRMWHRFLGGKGLPKIHRD
jgi:hypothetical protein